MSKDTYKTKILSLFNEFQYSHNIWTVFSDFVEIVSISISNSVDLIHRELREKRYLEIIQGYKKNERERFCEMFSNLIMSMENQITLDGPQDILGELFHELELHNKYRGQFFSPNQISDAMGFITLSDKEETIKEKGFVTVSEPCIGSGTMILGFAKAMKRNGYNYCSQMVVTGVDVDVKCVHMAYMQLSLYGIPAVIIHGNSLTTEEWSRWYTPVYVLNGWILKNKCGITERVKDLKIKEESLNYSVAKSA